MSEPLFKCPLCPRGNFTLRGLRNHYCRAKVGSRQRLSDAEIARAIANPTGIKLTESVTWHSVDREVPDEGLTVLVFVPLSADPVWLGFLSEGLWRDVGAGMISSPVTHWAHIPIGPS